MNHLDRFNAIINGLPEPTSFRIIDNGYERWYNKDNQLHRDNDQPAFIYSNGTQYWYKNGELHRDNDLPAIIWADGSKAWYNNGKLHRDNDISAFIDYSGYKSWYKNGVRYEPLR